MACCGPQHEVQHVCAKGGLCGKVEVESKRRRQESYVHSASEGLRHPVLETVYVLNFKQFLVQCVIVHLCVGSDMFPALQDTTALALH